MRKLGAGDRRQPSAMNRRPRLFSARETALVRRAKECLHTADVKRSPRKSQQLLLAELDRETASAEETLVGAHETCPLDRPAVALLFIALRLIVFGNPPEPLPVRGTQ